MAKVSQRTETVTQVTGYTLELSEEEAENLHALLFRGIGYWTLANLGLHGLSREMERARGNTEPGEPGMFKSTAQIP